MPDDKRGTSRLPVQARPGREIDTYSGGGGSAPVAAGTNVLAVAWRRRGVVLAMVVLALIGGGIYLMRATKMYSSSSLVLVQQGRTNIETELVGGGSGGSTGYLFTQCQLITSTKILSKALDEPGVRDAPILRGMENPVGYLRMIVGAVPAKQGDTITVSATLEDAQDAATIVNGIVQAYIDFENEQNKNSAGEVAKIVKSELEIHRTELRTAQAKMLDLRRANPLLGMGGDKGGMVAQRLAGMAAQVTDAQLKADELKGAVGAIDAVDQRDLAGLRAVVDQYKLSADVPPGNVQNVSLQYAQLKSQLQSLIDAGMEPNNEYVKRTQAALDRAGMELNAATQQAATACVTTVHAESTMADRRVEQLEKTLDAARKEAAGTNVIEAEYLQYDQQADSSRQEIAKLSDELIKLQAVQDQAPTTITQLEAGKVNTVPVSPQPTKTVALSLIGGLLAGVGAGLLLDKVDQRLRSVEEVVALLDTAVLGVVPRIVRRVLPGEAGREIQLKPRSGVAEAFRTIRTAIYFGGAGSAVNGAGKTILVTSPTPGDGKSTCISNLAIAVAQGGRRTLLIDADCRRPVQHKTFQVEDGPGLSGILTGRATLDEALRPTDVERLDLLPCGPLPHNPAELLDSQALLDLLGETARRYDQVLIDSPPVTLVSDARVLAASCDAAFLVVRHERSTRRGAQLAWNALSSVGANLLGVVVNDLSRQKDGYGYSYYGYGRYGGYAPAKDGNGDLPHNGNGNGKPAIAAAAAAAD